MAFEIIKLTYLLTADRGLLQWDLSWALWRWCVWRVIDNVVVTNDGSLHTGRNNWLDARRMACRQNRKVNYYIKFRIRFRSHLHFYRRFCDLFQLNKTVRQMWYGDFFFSAWRKWTPTWQLRNATLAPNGFLSARRKPKRAPPNYNNWALNFLATLF